MTSSYLQDQLLSIVARFIVEALPGEELVLPAKASLRKNEDGRLLMGRNGSFWPLHDETSDDIVARIVRWKEADDLLMPGSGA